MPFSNKEGVRKQALTGSPMSSTICTCVDTNSGGIASGIGSTVSCPGTLRRMSGLTSMIVAAKLHHIYQPRLAYFSYLP